MNTNEPVKNSLIFLGVIFVIANMVVSFIKGSTELAIMGPISSILITVFSFTHGVKRYGVKKMLFFVVMITIISWSYETSSILTGFPFGNYHYTDVLGPKLWLVPIIIMPAYFAVGYLSWVMGSLLLGKKDSSLKGAEVILLPILSAFIMVLWDISMDPINSTITKMWIWHDGGPYYGVPFVNYMGWYLCVFTFYLVFAFSLKGNKEGTTNVTWTNKAFWILPILMYAQHFFEYMGGALFKESVEVTSKDGHVWWTGDIYTGLTLVSIFTMIFISVLCLTQVKRVTNS